VGVAREAASGWGGGDVRGGVRRAMTDVLATSYRYALVMWVRCDCSPLVASASAYPQDVVLDM
jgi:hypothetical protein